MFVQRCSDKYSSSGCASLSFVFYFYVLVFVLLSKGISAAFADDSYCGFIITDGATNITLQLRENETLSDEDFDKIHVRKLSKAKVVPNSNCAIQICGFTSYGEVLEDGYIGTTSDYADCKIFSNQEETAPPAIFNSLYNVSSIACGCMRDSNKCTQTCPILEKKLNVSWNENDCAILYQEINCNSCYLQPVNLTKGQNFTTDHSHFIRTMIVRPNCLVKQHIPALQRMTRFKDIYQPIVYSGSNNSESNVRAAFQSDPEHFQCDCAAPAPPSPPSSTTTESPRPPSPKEWAIDWISAAGGGIAGMALLCFISATIYFCYRYWKKNRDKSASSVSSCETGSTTTSASSANNSDMTNDSDTMTTNEILNLPVVQCFKIQYACVQTGKALGRGNSGYVFTGNMTLPVAIKTARESEDDRETQLSKHSLEQELKILAQLGSHQNVVRLLGFSISPTDDLVLLTEFCQNGSMEKFLQQIVRHRINEKQTEYELLARKAACGEDGYPLKNDQSEAEFIQRMDVEKKILELVDPETLTDLICWCYQIASGMEFIHSKQTLHVDLATRNVLVTENRVAKIADFGLSLKTYIKNYVRLQEASVPLRWVSPEALNNQICSTKSDVWSFGVTAWEIFGLANLLPYASLSDFKICTFISTGGQLERPEFATEEIYEVMKDCWKSEADKRPSFTDLKSQFENMLTLRRDQNNDAIDVVDAVVEIHVEAEEALNSTTQ